jgi:hypothetical protein
MRASVAARETRTGLAGRVGLKAAMQEAILRFLSLLLAMVEDFGPGGWRRSRRWRGMVRLLTPHPDWSALRPNPPQGGRE